MPRLYGPDAAERLDALRFRTNGPTASRTGTASQCEECGRVTEWLFDGGTTYEAPRYGQQTRQQAGAERVRQVCQRCRPASNLEIDEILEAGEYKGRRLEI